MTAPAPTWYDVNDRVPRRGQTVRVLTDAGTDHAATFEVAHTDDWPSGAAWVLANGRASLPFTRVAQWSPDPEAATLAQTAAPPAEPEPAPAPRRPSQERPAVLTAALVEIDRTATVLQMLPQDQYDWSPHPDIVTLRTLARRLVRIVARVGWILELDAVEISFEPDLPDFETPEELVATYKANADVVRALIPTVAEDSLWTPWRLERNGEVIVETSRQSALRAYGISPMVYHRGEAAVLLTALGLAAPHPYPAWAFRDSARAMWNQP